MFKKIKFSKVLLITDSILSIFLAPFKCCCKSSCKKTWKKINERSELYDKCEQRFNKELEVTNILKKLRDTNDMLKNL